MASSTTPPDWSRLQRLLGEAPLASLVDLAADHPGRVALVGGAIRDALLGSAMHDLDLIVESGFDDFLASLERRLGRRPSAIGDRFQQTHRFRWNGVQVDVAESQGRIDEDLARRDFTVNAMGIVLPVTAGLPESLLDPFGGLVDLLAARLRQVGADALAADPLRVLRAVRYASALDFTVETATRAGVRSHAQGLSGVAVERIYSEWESILRDPRWVRGVSLATEFGATRATLGELETHAAIEAWAASERSEGVASEPLCGRLGALVMDLGHSASWNEIEQMLERGRWPARTVRRALATASWARGVDAPDSDPVGWALRSTAAAADAGRLAEGLARATGSPVPRRASQLRVYAARAGETPWVRGADLLDFGLCPGKDVGDLLATLRRGQLTRRWDGPEAAMEWASCRVGGGEL